MQKQQFMLPDSTLVNFRITMPWSSWISGMLSTLFIGTRCWKPWKVWFQVYILLSILCTPHHLLSFGKKGLSVLWRVYSRGTLWVHSFSACPFTLLSAEFCVEYLDDITLGSSTDDILHDLEVIMTFEELGLSLNNQKSEIKSQEGPSSQLCLGLEW